MKESEIDNDQNTMFGYCVGGYHMGTRPELESDHCACKRGEPKRKCGSKCFRAKGDLVQSENNGSSGNRPTGRGSKR